ncbi:DUF2142 domain-containing protein [Methanobacterium formicicum]|uniref:DUF2142 domain-containing protein n=1 Tax=Methanobacterium formicicum TaxID=2162 RepID=A0A843ALY8_METFO|nr:DUF2142 domain-containing protein [Methanobacterium formicicum]MBF4474381.1 DUF2142 domain-containing protein [Methanobacterium formicicum]
MINKIKAVEPQKVFLLIGLIFGLLFLLITPPFQAPDEDNHIYKAFSLSEGKIFPEKNGNENGIYVPQSLVSTIAVFSPYELGGKNFNPKNQDFKKIDYFLSTPLNRDNRIFLKFANTYPPLPYLAMASVMNIAALFNTPPLVLMYLDRIVNLCLWLFLTYLAIKITPIHKWVFLMLALMPMTLFISASISPDSLTIGLTFLIIAVFLNLSFDPDKKKIDNRDLGIVFLLTILVTLVKPLYFFSVLLFGMIPVTKFENRKQKWLMFILLIISMILTYCLWQHLMTGYVQTSASTSETLTRILNPANYLIILFDTIKLDGCYLLGTFVGILGWQDIQLPPIIVYLYISLLILVSLADKGQIIINLKQKLTILTPLILFLISLTIYFYITFHNSAYNDTIRGLTGRYFIPVAPLFFLLFYNNKNKIGNEINFSRGEKLNLLIILFIIFSLLISLFLIIKKYYPI